MVWKGLDVSFWGPRQTLYPARSRHGNAQWYNGYDPLTYDDLIEDIPLDIRYQDFKQRLEAALKH